MKLKSGIITENLNGDYVAIATGKAAETFNGIIHNNKTANFLFEQLMEDKDEASLVCALMEHYDVTEKIARTDVRNFLVLLKKYNLID